MIIQMIHFSTDKFLKLITVASIQKNSLLCPTKSVYRQKNVITTYIKTDA